MDPEDIKKCLYSISDNNSYLTANRDPCEKMIRLLRKYFRPDRCGVLRVWCPVACPPDTHSLVFTKTATRVASVWQLRLVDRELVCHTRTLTSMPM